MKLRRAQTSTQVVQSFCSFFKHSGQYSPALRQHCASQTMSELIKNENAVEAEIQASAVLQDGERPMTINPDLEGKVVYSRNKVEALTRAFQSREL
jgi:hypothetical protein